MELYFVLILLSLSTSQGLSRSGKQGVLKSRSKGFAKILKSKRSAAVFGGGMAGLTAAMELSEAGFKVDLYEKDTRFGGKMLGYMTKKKLSTEHCFRFYGWKYFALGDVFERAGLQPPTADNKQSPNWREIVNDDVFGTRLGFTDGNTAGFQEKIIESGISLAEVSYFGFQVAAYRQLSLEVLNSLYGVTFTEFLDGFAFQQWQQFTGCIPNTVSQQVYCKPAHSEAFHSLYNNFLGIYFAAKPSQPPPVSMYLFERTVSGVLEKCVPYYKYFNSRYAASGPTSIVVVDPLVKHLKSLGITLHASKSLEQFDYLPYSNQISSARINYGKQQYRVKADAYIMALPVDNAEDILPGVTKGRTRSTAWSSTFQIFLPCLPDDYIQFYFNQTRFTVMWDSPYAIAYQIQSPYDGAWEGSNIRLNNKYDYILSVSVSNVTEPGLNGKSFFDSTRKDALAEILHQINFPATVRCRRRSSQMAMYTHRTLIANAQNGLYLFDLPRKLYEKNKDTIYRSFVVGPVKSDGRRWALTSPVFEPAPDTSPIGFNTEFENLFLAGEFVSAPLLSTVTMEHAAESGKIAAQAAVDYLGLDYKVPLVEELLDLVNAKTVDDYRQKIEQGLFSGTC